MQQLRPPALAAQAAISRLVQLLNALDSTSELHVASTECHRDSFAAKPQGTRR